VKRAFVTALISLAFATSAQAVTFTQVGSFSSPVHVTGPPGDPHRLFVTERAGRVMETRDGVALAQPFLDITSAVQSGGEKGLLSASFAPDYAASGLFYVYYTRPRPGDSTGDVIVIEEFRRSSSSADQADPASGRILLTIDHPSHPNHNGGQLQFSPDGLLYASVGDGGSGGANSQDLGNLLGKILRIDPHPSGGQPYGIPAGNPFGGSPIWAYGLRNPWRFSFDRATGDLTIADVGESSREEVDFAPAASGGGGVNYGWPCYEGTLVHSSSPPCPVAGTTMPVLEKDHSTDGFCAIVGGYVVRDPALGSLAGRYVYGDNCNSGLRSASLATPNASGDSAVGVSVPATTSFGEDSCGHVYVASLNGPVYRLDEGTFTPCPESPGSGLPPGGASGTPSSGSVSGAGADNVAPTLTLSRRRLQRLLRQGAVLITARCSEPCAVTAGGVLRVGGSAGSFGVKQVSRGIPAGRAVTLRLRVSRRGLRAAARGLRRHRRVMAVLTVVARDPAGNSRAARTTVLAKR
jgi:hypothetical protein